MKAIKVIEPFKIEIVDIDKPKIIKDDDVIVRVTSGGICGSDMGIYNGTNSLATYPRLIGHEFGGIVSEVGSKVMKVKVGDKVAVDPVISCGTCYACTHGKHNVCSNLEVMGVHRDGGFSEYIKADEKNIYKFETDFDENLLGLVEPFTIGVQINDRGQIGKDDKVLIMGAGPIGICTMQVAKKNGAQVIISDIVKERLDKAKSMGADETVLIPNDTLTERLDIFTEGEGVQVIVDTVCTPTSLEQAVSLSSPAGKVVCIGLKNQYSKITMAEITKKELTIVGSRLSNHKFSEVIKGALKGDLQLDKLMTKAFNYKDVEKAFELIKNEPQSILKVVLTF